MVDVLRAVSETCRRREEGGTDEPVRTVVIDSGAVQSERSPRVGRAQPDREVVQTLAMRIGGFTERGWAGNRAYRVSELLVGDRVGLALVVQVGGRHAEHPPVDAATPFSTGGCVPVGSIRVTTRARIPLVRSSRAFQARFHPF